MVYKMIKKPIHENQKIETYAQTKIIDIQNVEAINYRDHIKRSYLKPTHSYSLAGQQVLKFMSRSPPP